MNYWILLNTDKYDCFDRESWSFDVIDVLLSPLRVIARALVLWWDDAINLVIINLAWSVSWFTVILGPPATFGLYYVANELANGRGVGLSGLTAAARRFFWQSWLWALPNILIFIGILVQAPLFQRLPAFGLFTTAVATAWLIVQFYALPYFMEQEAKNLFVAWRNGLLTALASPVYSCIVFAFAAAVTVSSIMLAVPLFAGGVCLVALLGSSAVIERIEAFGIRKS